MKSYDPKGFGRSVEMQIEVNLARTPTERLLALCDLLDSARALAPDTPEARERRMAALERRDREREEHRAWCRRIIAGGRVLAIDGG